jgi:DNA repair protein RadC
MDNNTVQVIEKETEEAQQPGLPLFDFAVNPVEKKSVIKAKEKHALVSLKVKGYQRKIQEIREEAEKLYNSKALRNYHINAPADAVDLMMPLLSVLEFEELWMMALDRRNHVMGIFKIYSGSASSSQIRVGEIFRPAIIINSSSLLIFHNHPSGDPTPSPDDVVVTRAVHQAGKLLDIELLDHVVIGDGKWVSLKERGLGFS